MKTVSQSLYFLYWQQHYQIFGSPAIRNCGSKLYAEKLLIPCKKGSKGAAAGKQLWIFRRFSTAEEYDSSAGRRIGRQQQQPGGRGEKEDEEEEKEEEEEQKEEMEEKEKLL